MAAEQLPGISAEITKQFSEIDIDDRTENLAAAIASFSHLKWDATATVLLGISHVNWNAMREFDRASMIDYCARLLGNVGLTIAEKEGRNG